MDAAKDRQRKFFEWLAKSVSSAQLSELYQAFTDFESDVDQKRFSHGLDRPLIETTDIHKLEALYRGLNAYGRFTKTNRSGIKLAVLKHYIRFIQENSESSHKEMQLEQSKASTGDLLIDRLRQDGIDYVDNRSKNGALWITVTPKTDAFLHEFQKRGVEFTFAHSKGQWWTRHAAITETVPVARDVETVNANREAFYRWLKDQGMDVVTVYSVLGTARKIDHMIISEGVSQLGLFALRDTSEVHEISQKIAKNAAFIRSDNNEKHFWKETLQQYWHFSETVKPVSSEKNVMEDSKKAIEVPAPALSKEDAVAENKVIRKDITSEEAFRNWLKGHSPEESVGGAIAAIYNAESFARRNHLMDARLFGVSGAVARKTAYRLIANAAYAKAQGSLWSTLKQILPQFEAYTRELGKTEAISEASPQKKETASPVMDSALSELLADELYSDLRKALIEKGILTMEAFRTLNLWVFMNQNGLYNIKQRNQVFRQLQPKPIERSTSEIAVIYTLKTVKTDYTGDSPAEVLLHYCQAMAARHPLGIRSAIGMPYNGNGSVVLQLRPNSDADLHMAHPSAYIDIRISREAALDYAKWICKVCKDTDMPIVIGGGHRIAEQVKQAVEKSHDTDFTSGGQEAETNVQLSFVDQMATPTMPIKPAAPANSILQTKVEEALLKADLDGMTLDQLAVEFPSVTMVSLKQVRDASKNIVEMPDNKLIHKGAFVDLDEAAEKIGAIIEKLLNRNNGYVSVTQLYEYVRAEMQMFLNDNGISDEKSVYCIARHLFEKVEPRYTFSGNKHISRSGDGALRTKQDIIQNFARDHGGFFLYDDLDAYMKQVGVKQFRLGPEFYFYSSDEVIASECMGIDDPWLQQVRRALDRLFDDMGDHVVLRSILPIWFEQLPTLPSYRPWTPLLFQYVIGAHGDTLKVKTIHAEINQQYDTIHAMLVSEKSEVQTFGDAVIAHLVDNEIEQRQFEAEELRQILVRGKLIVGNELIWNMRRAVGNDPRYASRWP